ncbi:hypothetical protein AgCh_019006 [Apium graveolens]
MKEVTFKKVKCKTGGLIPRKGDARNGDYVTSLEGFDTRCMDSVWLAIKTSGKMNDYSRIKLPKIEAAEKGVVKLWWYSEWEHIRNTKVDVDEVVERKMLRSAVVQRTKDMIDLIRGRLVVAQDGHDTKGQRV